MLAVWLTLSVLPPLHAQNNSADNPTGSAGSFNGNVTTGCCYDPYTGNAKRVITDLVVPGSCSAYPLTLTRTYNSNLEPTGYDFEYFGDGINWRHSYQWSITPVEYINGKPTIFELSYPDGSVVRYQAPGSTSPNEITGYWRGPAGTSDRLEVSFDNSNDYTLHTSDGGLVVFAGGFRPTSIVDPNGATTILTYAPSPSGTTFVAPRPGQTPGGYLTKVTEPGGRTLQFSYTQYTQKGSVWYLLSSVVASTGQSVSYSYGPSGGNTHPGQGNTPYLVLQGVTYNDETSTTGSGQPVTASYTVTTNVDSLPQLSEAVDPHYAGAMTSIQYGYNVTTVGSTLAEQNYGSNVGETVSRLDIVDSTAATTSTVSRETRGDSPDHGPDITRTFTYGGNASAASFQLTSMTDFEGNTAVLSYDQYGYVNSRQDFAGITTTYTNEPITGKVTTTNLPGGYTRSAQWTNKDDNVTPPLLYPYYLHSTTNEQGQTTFYKHDSSSGLVTEIDYPDGGKESFTYQAFSYGNNPTFYKVQSHTTRLGATIYYSYDGSGDSVSGSHGGSGYMGLLTAVRRFYADGYGNSQKEVTQLYYDSFDRLSASVDPSGVRTSYTYNARHQLLSSTHAADGTSVVYTYDDYGRRLSVQDENRHTTSTTYDEYGRPVSVTQPVSSSPVVTRTVQTTYDVRDTHNNFIADAASHTSNLFSYQFLPSGRGVQHIYSPNGWLTDEYIGLTNNNPSSPFFSQALHTKAFATYDPMGRLLSYADNQLNVWSNSYDSIGRLFTTTDPLGHVTTTNYYAPNSVGSNQVNCSGLVASVYLPDNGNSQTNYKKYDAYDQMGRSINWDVSTSSYVSGYDYAGDLINQTDDNSNNTNTGYSYDQLGRKIGITYPDGTTEAWHYDASGNVYTYKNRAGNTQSVTAYDSRNRPTNWTWNDGSTPGLSIALDPVGRCTSMSNGVCALAMGYDDSNALTSEEQIIGGNTSNATVTYAMDPDGNIYNVTYPHGDKATLETDFATRLQYLDYNLAGNTGPATRIAVYGYGTDSRLQTQSTLNNLGTTYTYQNNNRLSGVSHQNTATGAVISNESYGFYPNGQLSWFQRNAATNNSNAFNNNTGDAYSYHPDGSIESVTYQAVNVAGTANPSGDSQANTSSGAQRTDQYGFDGAGNRILDTENGVANNPQFDLEDRQIGLKSDQNGNVTSAPYGAATGNYVYNAYNQLVSASVGGNSVNFTYDPKGRLCQRTINGATTTLYYAGNEVVEEDDSNNNKLAFYLYGAGGRREYRVDSSVYCYQYDGRGFLTHVTDPVGNVDEQYLYDAFGKPNIYNASGAVSYGQTSAIPSGNRYLWAQGYEWYPEIGLYRCGARFYSPALGRFMQPDPIGQKGGLNIYTYCKNDPINGSDPTGLDDTVSTVKLPYDTSGWPSDLNWAFNSTGGNTYGLNPVTHSAGYQANYYGSVSNFEGYTSTGVPVAAASAVIPGSDDSAKYPSYPATQTYPHNPFVVEGIDLACFVEGVVGNAFGIAFGTIDLAAGIIDLDPSTIKTGYDTIVAGLLPRYGLFAGPDWGIPETYFGQGPMWNPIDVAAYNHDVNVDAAKSLYGDQTPEYNNARIGIDNQLVSDSSAGPLGIFGLLYKLGLDPLFSHP